MATQCKGGMAEPHGQRLMAGVAVCHHAHRGPRQKTDFDQTQNQMLVMGISRHQHAADGGILVEREVAEAEVCSRGGHGWVSGLLRKCE